MRVVVRNSARSLMVGVLLLVVTAPAGGPGPTARAAAKDEAMSQVRALAGRIGPRPAGTAATRRAVRYLAAELESYGYVVTLQGFRLPQGGRSRNVVARAPGVDPATSLVLGAHHDTVAGSPGGNDNASGVAVLLQTARRLIGESPDITFVAFGAEEFQPGTGQHHIGSQAYVRAMDDAQRDALVAMVSVDMVGKARRYTVGRLADAPRRAAGLLARAVRSSGSRARVRVLGDISDHGPFALAGMPAAFLWTGFEANHHEPTDRVRNVAPRALRRGIRALLALAGMAGG